MLTYIHVTVYLTMQDVVLTISRDTAEVWRTHQQRNGFEHTTLY